MKKSLLIFLFACVITQVKAQIIITGYFPEPEGTDAPASGGWEYIQFRATENINFATTPYAVVIANLAGAPATADGWATKGKNPSGSSTMNYQFSLTSGIVNKGDFFYVGNIIKLICGTVSTVNSTDISETATLPENRALWIRNKNVGNEPGDDGIGEINTAGFLPYGQSSAIGIGVFNTTTITPSSIPLDAVFYGNAIGSAYSSTNPTYGYLVPSNDLYNPVNPNDQSEQKLFGQGTNTTLVAPRSTSGDKIFYALGGDYNTTTKNWDATRRLTKIQLNVASQLSVIQSGAGTTTLPVKFISFSGKKQAASVSLKWSTASESNSSHFEVTRSVDGRDFKSIGKVSSVGNSTAVQHYSFVDNLPNVGVNYYQLKQIDFNGNSELSSVVAITNAFNGNTFSISANGNNSVALIEALENASASLLISNTAGKKVFEKQLKLVKGLNTLSIDLSKLNSGIYVASLTSADKKTVVVKFAKN